MENETSGPYRRLRFDDVQKEEIAAGCPPPGKAVGLAFSGGGIRSATFNLGVIQALAKLGLLARFDYLSTISGGGYIGAWLSTYIKRHAGGSVEEAQKKICERDGPLEQPAIRFLRQFSNYLTPHTGLSMDALAAAATYLRNLLLNLTLLVLLLAALLLLPRIAVGIERLIMGCTGFAEWYDAMLLAPLALAGFMVAENLRYRPVDRAARPWFTHGPWLLWLVDLPVLAAAFIAATYYATVGGIPIDWKDWVGSIALLYVGLWVVGLGLSRLVRWQWEKPSMSISGTRWHVGFFVCALVAGAVGAGILMGVAKVIGELPDGHRDFAVVVLGPPAIVCVFLLILTLHIGLMARLFDESDRELWSVFGARLLAVSIAWAVVSAIAIYGPPLIDWSGDLAVALGGGAWILTTLFGVFAGKSPSAGKGEEGRKPWFEPLVRLAPYVFALGLLLLIAWGIARVLAPAERPGDSTPTAEIYLKLDRSPGSPVVVDRNPDAPGLWKRYVAHSKQSYDTTRRWFTSWYYLPLFFLGCMGLSVLLSTRVKINLFSLHHFYRNRLTRCYLGATNPQRRPHPLSGFDPADDLPMSGLRGQRPLHIVGTAINLNRGSELAWQNRRAASFTFTPLHVGYEPASRHVQSAYRDASEYGKGPTEQPIPLGTAVAISGAAANPNQGFHTSPAVAFLMTLFNVRLGHWCGDPARSKSWRRRDPRNSLRYWLAELTGSAGQGLPFVSLSDGGHFENLGVYELVRRRCALIVASDGGADPEYGFEDLAEAIRKCYTDFGAEFRFTTKVDDIRPSGEDRLSKTHVAIADIIYRDGTEGKLVYWKSSLTEALPADIMNYYRENKAFPHQSTADQFFDESQFESYRRLGYEVATRSIANMRAAGSLPPQLA